jgi:hypothetical protein
MIQLFALTTSLGITIMIFATIINSSQPLQIHHSLVPSRPRRLLMLATTDDNSGNEDDAAIGNGKWMTNAVATAP